MDIDSPPAALPDAPQQHSHTHLNLPTFSASFPLPFRVLFLIGLAQLLWAANLHILHLLGVDISWILDFRDEPREEDSTLDLGSLLDGAVRTGARPESKALYGPVYRLFLVYTAWVGGGWVLFRVITGGDEQRMESWRGFVGFIALGVGVGAMVPWNGVGERERKGLRRAIKRIILPPLDTPVFFSDVILADILTSFAKVLGDLWISTCQIWFGGITKGRVAQTGWANWITLSMVCFPYLMRFRQCVLQSYHSSWNSIPPLFNALKYFSAFPVILLSATQKFVVLDVAASKGMSVQELRDSGDRWFGEHPLFRLWLFAVVVNSTYSFWWDIEMDWGLGLCELDTWLGGGSKLGSPIRGGRRIDSTLIGRVRQLVTGRSSISHQRSPCPTPPTSFTRSNPQSLLQSPILSSSRLVAFGLRPTLLLPDPLVYHLFALIDLVLRFTWSLKLSSHLHTISEIESGVFLMEGLELVRRWMWVFVRVEWEAVKMAETKGWQARTDTRGLGVGGTIIWENGEKGDGI